MATDIFQLLENDHREVKSMMRKIAEGNGDARRRDLFEKFKTELMAHAKCEEREFYSVLQRNEETAEKVEHSFEEHAEAEEGLQELSQMSDDDEDWMEKFSELRNDVEHHAEEEEKELFPKARKVIGERAEEIGRRFEEAKRQYLSRGSGARQASTGGEPQQRDGERGEDFSSLTRDELYERARKLGIEGRSKMTKNELARAVRARG